jgi:hypothetical protein
LCASSKADSFARSSSFTLTPEQRESINDWSDLSLRLLGEGWTFKTDKKNDRIIATHVSGVEQVVISEVFLTYNKP